MRPRKRHHNRLRNKNINHNTYHEDLPDYLKLWIFRILWDLAGHREFLNSLENQHSGIKNNLYQSILKISQIVKKSSTKQKTICEKCGNECTGNVCSVCSIVLKLKENQT